MSWAISNAFKGSGGEFEVIRLLGAAGIAAYIVGAHTFVAYDVMWMKRPFDLTMYCLAFPAGLAAVLAAVAGSAAWKDKGVANAKVTAAGAAPVEKL